MREQVIQMVEKEKLVVIVRGVQKEKLIPMAEAVYEGGVRLMELTFDAKGIVSDEETTENIRMLAQHFEGRMFVGAGTVLTEKQVELTKNAGGLFIISPDASENVIRKTRELGLVSMPGALTPTEIQMAHKAGADFVKVFPLSCFGPDYLKAVKAPLSHIKLLAVGGVDEHNVQEFLKAGASGVGSTNIINKGMIAANDFAGITAVAAKYVKAASK